MTERRREAQRGRENNRKEERRTRMKKGVQR